MQRNKWPRVDRAHVEEQPAEDEAGKDEGVLEPLLRAHRLEQRCERSNRARQCDRPRFGGSRE